MKRCHHRRWRLLIAWFLFPSFISSLTSALLLEANTRLNVVLYNRDNRIDSHVDSFYRSYYRNAKPMHPKPGDLQVSLVRDNDDSIIATVRLCKIDKQGWIFLRSLCVCTEYRNQGIGTSLLLQSMDEAFSEYKESLNGIYCFAEPSLSKLYEQVGFRKSTTHSIPKFIHNRFKAVSKRVQGRGMELECFQWSRLSLALLQHKNEVQKTATSTATLLLGSRHVRVNKAVWSGRADNLKIQNLLEEQQGNLVLLWNGGSSNATSVAFEITNTTFVLLDGTWQEAQSMFRKMPALQKLPRLTIEAHEPSRYHLRGNYGWKQRFTSLTPLCTVETVSELLQQACNNSVGRAQLQQKLDTFQGD